MLIFAFTIFSCILMQAESAFTEITSKSCDKKLLQSVIAHPVLISDYLVPKLQETMQVFFSDLSLA